MGLDFLRRTAPSFTRALDRQMVELRTPTLFASDIRCMARTAAADVRSGATIAQGERLIIRLQGDKLVAQRENFVVAEFCNPPREYISRVQNSGGVELGEVKSVHQISGVVEVELCE
jgi:hypothetical protein